MSDAVLFQMPEATPEMAEAARRLQRALFGPSREEVYARLGESTRRWYDRARKEQKDGRDAVICESCPICYRPLQYPDLASEPVHLATGQPACTCGTEWLNTNAVEAFEQHGLDEDLVYLMGPPKLANAARAD